MAIMNDRSHPVRLASLLLAFLLLAARQVQACTIFVLTDAEDALFCNNEDWSNFNTRIWFDPGDASHLGCAVVGYDNGWWQGGLNTSGLAFDWVSGWNEKRGRAPGMESLAGNPKSLMLQTCTSVDQAIGFYRLHWDPSFSHAKILVADRSGASVIIGAHEGVLTVERETQCRGFGYGHRILEKMLAENSKPTPSNGAGILWAARQDGYFAMKYANIYDLRTGDIYLFPHPGRREMVRFNLMVELRKGGHFYDMPRIGVQIAEAPRPLALMGPLPRQPWEEITLPPGELGSYVGRYPIRPNLAITLTQENGALFMEVTGQARARLCAWSRGELFLKVIDAQVSMHRDASGDVDGLVLHQNGQNVPAKRVSD